MAVDQCMQDKLDDDERGRCADFKVLVTAHDCPEKTTRPCPEGFYFENGIFKPDNCPPGEHRENGVCVPVSNSDLKVQQKSEKHIGPDIEYDFGGDCGSSCEAGLIQCSGYNASYHSGMSQYCSCYELPSSTSAKGLYST